MKRTKVLEIVASAMLRKNGFTYSGFPKKDVNPAQQYFERKFIVNPVGTAR